MIETIALPPMIYALSPSSMTTWKQCPRRFWYEKLLHIGGDVGEAAIVGWYVHLIMERLMALPGPERTPDTAMRIAAMTFPEFSSDPDYQFETLALDDDGIRAFKHKTWLGILGYFQLEDPSTVQVASTEQHVQTTFGMATVHGIIDRTDIGDDGLIINDYKSGKAPQFPGEREEKLDQLLTYAAILDALGNRVKEVRLLYVSPQVGADAKCEQTQADEMIAMAQLENLLPSIDAQRLLDTLRSIEDANRDARMRVSKAEAKAAGDAAVVVAAEKAAQLADELTDKDEVARAYVVAVNARKRSFFARRTAENAVPVTVSMSITEEVLLDARKNIVTVWDDVQAHYTEGEFPGQVGPLCGWCPFNGVCPDYKAQITLS